MAISFAVTSDLQVAQTLTVSSLASALLRVDANGVVSTTSLQSNLSLSSGTLSLASALTSITSVTAGAATSLTLSGGSSGASLVLGQGTNGSATVSPAGSGWLAVSKAMSSTSQFTSTRIVEIANTNTTSDNWAAIDFVDSAGGSTAVGLYAKFTDHTNDYGQLHLVTRGSGGLASRAIVTELGNLLIGTTSETGLTGASGLKVASSTASTSTSTGALVVSGGAGFAGAVYASSFTAGSTGQSSALITARIGGNDFEWGHANTAGYGSTLGANTTNGRPFLAFNAEAGTTGNTFRTRGIVGRILQADLLGGLLIGRATTASADNQSLTTDVTVSGSDGSVTLAATTAATSTTTGAFQCAGGAGIAGAVYVGGAVMLEATAANIQMLTASTSQKFIRMASTGGDLYVGIESSTAGTFFTGSQAYESVWYSPTDNSFFNTPLARFSGAMSLASTTASTSTTTGSLINSGGFGNAGAAYIGGVIVGAGNAQFGNGVFLSDVASKVHRVTGQGGYQIYLDATPTKALRWLIDASGNSLLDTYNGSAWATALTIANGAGAITLGSASSITAASATNLTLAGGSSGASLVLGQGTNANATISGSGTGFLIVNTSSDALEPTLARFLNGGASTPARYNQILFGTSLANGGGAWLGYKQDTATPANGRIYLAHYGKNQDSAGVQISYAGNLLVGGTTEISGAGGLKVFGTTAATSTTSGALQVAGGVGVAGKGYIGGGLDVSGGSIVQTSVNVTALSLTRSGTSNSVNISATNDAGTSYFGRPTGGFFAVGPNVDLSSSPHLSINTSGDTTLAGDLTVSGGNVGVGEAANAARGISVASSALSGSAQYGVITDAIFTSSATTSATALYGRVRTAAASFTVADAYALYAASPSLGAGSALTTAFGLYVVNQGMSGVTHAYGIDIAAQSGALTTNVGLRNAGTTLLTNTTASTSTTSGALVVSGGVGVAGAINVGSYISASSGATLALRGGDGGSGTTLAAFSSTGGSGPYVTIRGDGVITVAATAEATSTTAAALVCSGGIAAAKSAILGGGLGLGVASTATAGSTTTLAAGSKTVQVFTGSSAQTVQLPAANLMGSGISVTYVIVNRSTVAITLDAAGSDLIEDNATYNVLPGARVIVCSDGSAAWSLV